MHIMSPGHVIITSAKARGNRIGGIVVHTGSGLDFAGSHGLERRYDNVRLAIPQHATRIFWALKTPGLQFFPPQSGTQY